jgi:hypothetical protein
MGVRACCVELSAISRIFRWQCLVVPYSSHKQEIAGSIFLDRDLNPDPFSKSDRIPHSDPLAFSGSAIQSEPP